MVTYATIYNYLDHMYNFIKVSGKENIESMCLLWIQVVEAPHTHSHFVTFIITEWTKYIYIEHVTNSQFSEKCDHKLSM